VHVLDPRLGAGERPHGKKTAKKIETASAHTPHSKSLDCTLNENRRTLSVCRHAICTHDSSAIGEKLCACYTCFLGSARISKEETHPNLVSSCGVITPHRTEFRC